jgi:hypothetical protein
MKKKVLSAVIAIFLLTLAVSGFAQSFSTSDLEGIWIGYDISVMPAIPAVIWLRGTATMDASGNLTAGTYILPDETTLTLTGGNFKLDSQGVMSGIITVDTGDTVTVVNGKLDQSKTNGVWVSVATDGSLDIGYYFKTGGTFTTSDLEGTWYGYQTIIDASTGAVFWVYGTYNVDASGSVIGSFTGADGSPVTVGSGTLSLDSAGIITGNLALSTGQTPTIVHGKIDQGKTRGVFVGIETTDGSMFLAHLVKAGGTFKQSDGAGNWYVYGLNIFPSIPAVVWAYGQAHTDASGNLTGSYTIPTGDSVTGTGVSSMDSAGVVTSNITLSTGDTSISPSTKMDQGKTSSTGVSINDPSGAMGIWLFLKKSNVPLSALPSLLLFDE